MNDIVIIGGGPGGYVAAIRAAQLGAEVVLVEKDRLGGTCLNRGCIPTKAYYRNAQFLNDMRQARSFGIAVEGFSVDIKKMLERKQLIVNHLNEGIGHLLKANGVEVVNGTGSIVDRETVEVTDASGFKTRMNVKNIIIAAGSVPARPFIPGINLTGVMTSDELLELEELPREMIIIGGGVIGIEFAGIYQALGTKVTVLEFMPQILPALDGEIARRLTLSLKKKGVRFETGVGVKEIISEAGRLKVLAEGKNGEIGIETDVVLVATGRTVNVSSLNLEALGIEYDHKGIKVDRNYQTSVPGIFAIGDVIGGQMLAHVASDEGKAVVEHILGLEGHLNYDAIPSCVFTFPEVASVGLSEEEAKKRGVEYTASKFPFAACGKALTMGEEEGFVKVLVEKGTGHVVGTHILGPHASDLIHEAAVAVENQLGVSHIAKTVHAHPTLSEALAEAVLGVENRAIHMAPKRGRK